MKLKKILIILLTLILAVAICTSPVVAKIYKTGTIKFKDDISAGVDKKLGHSDHLNVYYNSKYSPQHENKNIIHITTWSKFTGPEPRYYRVYKATIKFKKIKGKTKYITKTYTANKKYGSWSIYIHPPKGYTPKTTTVYYKKL
ncbi:hypothetical protein [Methanobrevibacter curvatus]|uniref:Uncharacterized protein n=1 Tax=Methanobrevibacter curvatus TaxID=49547 RepID=A0A166E9F3_9EURY|nr:hypothetical protein [Methanobrevibacter curvatus]KZX16416.1 hypothetical protein MBCUR_00800 [Methanobrevibacter curvatus]